MSPTRRAAIILAAIGGFESIWVGMSFAQSGWRFVAYLGFASGKAGGVAGWVLAAIVTAAFVAVSVRLPSVRANLLRPSGLKALALVLAFSAGILEELVFRRLLMDASQARGAGVVPQVVISAVAFGVMHGVWGLFGKSIRAAIGATIATALLGGALAVVYIAGGRSLAPCVSAHFLINLLIEPGLVLAAVRSEMSMSESRT